MLHLLNPITYPAGGKVQAVLVCKPLKGTLDHKCDDAVTSWLPWWLDAKESACNAGDAGSIPGLARTHASILAWRSLWTEKPGGLQSMGSQRVGHD